MRMSSRRTPLVLAFATVLALGVALPTVAGVASARPAVHSPTFAGVQLTRFGAVTAQVTTSTTSVVEQIDDPASTRTVNRIIAALLVLGGVLLAVTVWFWVATRPLHPALEGLDLMSRRSWARADASKQQRMLDKVHKGRGVVDERVVPAGQVGGPVERPVSAG